MISRTNILVRPLAALLVILALAAPWMRAADASAQFTRQLPSPVAATELDALLRAAGAEQSTLDIAARLHESYFAEFRAFEEREVDASLRATPSTPFDPSPSVEDARKVADARRRIFARAAQIDGALVDGIIGALTPDSAAKIEGIRNALARRRAIAAVPSAFGKGPHAFDLRSTAAIASLDRTAQAALAPLFTGYEQELTRQLERLAEASFVRRVRTAEAREKLGVAASPAAGGDMAQWMRTMAEVQRTAGEEMAAIDARIRKLHRDTLAAIAPALPVFAADALRSQFVRDVYLAIGVSGEFDAVRKAAESLRAKGSLDDARWAEAEGVVRAHGAALNPVVDAMLAILDARAAKSDDAARAFGTDDAQQDENRLEPLREQANTVIARDAAALRAAIGADSAAEKPEIAVRGGEIGGMTIEGGVQIMAIGGDGEAISLSTDDLVDGGLVLGGVFGGGGGSVVKPMSREELDRLAERLGFGADTRAVFDEIAARCAEARNAAEQADKARAPAEKAAEDGGTMSITLSIGEDGGFSVGERGPQDARALAQAIDAAEERMFDELKAAADPAKADAAESARRARARTRLLVGERGAQTADIVRIVEDAQVGAAAQAAIGEEVRTWDESSVAALRTMRDEVQSASDERAKLLEEVTSQEDDAASDGNGETRISRTVRMDEEVMEKMQQVDARVESARTKVATRNRAAVDAIVAKLESEPAAAKAVRRGLYRVIEPGAYRIPRDLAPFFAKASAIEGLRAEARTALAAMEAEWAESREALCESYAAEREKERSSAKPSAQPGAVPLGALGINAQARKRLVADLEQLEATIYRRLRELVETEVGATKAAAIGELPAKKKRTAPAIQFGNT